MSNKELAINIINSLPDTQVDYVLSILQNFSKALEDASDAAFCEKLYQDYLNDSDTQKNESIALEALASQLGISL